MSQYKVSIRYSSALFETAIYKKLFEVISEDVKFILKVFHSSKQLVSVMDSPVIKGQLKLSIIDEIFKDKINIETLYFLRFVIKKGRENYFINIFEKYLDLMDEHLGIVNVDVKTAFKFDDNQSKVLTENLGQKLNKQIRLNYSIDETIIGGFIAKIGDTVHDASVKHQLELLKKKFLEGGATLN
ncbi:MAG: ATP synthase F1 subunit delta [Ignavibacteriales bacterium CG_4_9_14_3_um_filter_30_11]|nr:MAG: ATP synthase F1 subunit delta [Ignavibacteriales bacterium CG_4_9_14_3_um_filter_30_11]PJC59060.1 MAG: ATP synthase F1 subunit delta [Ignavibacteria bacterium CG_4_9_14_0_2_um_filter_37_13]